MPLAGSQRYVHTELGIRYLYEYEFIYFNHWISDSWSAESMPYSFSFPLNLTQGLLHDLISTSKLSVNIY